MRQGVNLSETQHFKTAGQQLSEQIKKMKRGKRGPKKSYGQVKKRKTDGGRHGGKTRQQRGRGVKRSGVVRRLFGDDPEFPPTNYISQKAFQLRKDIFNGYK